MIKYNKIEVKLVSWLIEEKGYVQIEFLSGPNKGSRVCANTSELEGNWKSEAKKIKQLI